LRKQERINAVFDVLESLNMVHMDEIGLPNPLDTTPKMIEIGEAGLLNLKPCGEQIAM
jgi:hypothetical protein